MDAPVREDSDFNLHDMVSSSSEPNPDASLIDDSLSIEIERALETLPQKESDVLKLYFGLGGYMPLSLNEIGEVFDLTRERVRQIKEKAIRRLRHTSRNKILKTYLG
jgi:RNA polymerase primary sigma factor